MRKRLIGGRVLPAAALASGLLVLGVLHAGWGAEPVLERASVSAFGEEGNATSLLPAVSADGRFVAFASDASNLVPGDTNSRDIFVRDRQAGTTELVSVASDGTQANQPASFPAISGDGRYVAFESEADNLVPNDRNGASDIFVHDRLTGATERVSVASDGTEGNGDSLTPAISADGRYVTFTSLADNLVPGDTNDDRDVFLHDRITGETELVSVASDGTQGNFASGGLGAGPARISSDGRYVVFGSFASNLVPDDTNQVDDVLIRDRVAGITERVSVASDGTEGNSHSMYGDVSDDGRYVVFHSLADNLVADDNNAAADIFLRDRVAGTTIRLSEPPGGEQANGASRFPVISADGHLVAYESDAPNLVPGDTNASRDVFLLDLQTGVQVRVSVAGDGSDGDGASASATINADGAVLAFQSNASNLVPEDTNGAADIFVWGKPVQPAATPTQTLTPVPTETPMPPAEPGDVDCGGAVTSIDAALVLQFVAALLDALPCPTAADVNEDGAVTSIDAALILQYVAGLLDSLPP